MVLNMPISTDSGIPYMANKCRRSVRYLKSFAFEFFLIHILPTKENIVFLMTFHCILKCPRGYPKSPRISNVGLYFHIRDKDIKAQCD